MLKVGDKVVCISNKLDRSNYLIKNNTYTITKFPNDDVCFIDNKWDAVYSTHRFKLLSDFRKDKIKKLKYLMY
jgi:hypothetical protein